MTFYFLLQCQINKSNGEKYMFFNIYEIKNLYVFNERLKIHTTLPFFSRNLFKEFKVFFLIFF